MIGRRRAARLGLVVAHQLWGHRGRTMLLAILIAVSMLIFLALQSLAFASGRALDRSIASDLGVEGSYDLRAPTTAADPADSAAAMVDLLVRHRSPSYLVVASWGTVSTACPLDRPAGDGDREVFVLLEARSPDQLAGPTAPATNEEAPASGTPRSVCLAGLVSERQQAIEGPVGRMLRSEAPVLLDATELRQVTLALGPPRQVIATAVVGGAPDQTDELHRSLVLELAAGAARRGRAAGWSDAITVSRLDGGASVREAGRGVRVVYGSISWGVLALGGLALLVAQLMLTQQRRWSFGLARAFGATRLDLVVIVAIEVVIVVAVGAVTAATVAAAAQAPVEQWVWVTFGERIRIPDPASIPPFVLGAVLIALVGAFVPALRAARLDPLVALEG